MAKNKEMKNITKTLEKALKLTQKGVVYPPDLLIKHNEKIQLDREHLGHLINGGEGGGYLHFLTLLTQYSDAKTIVELGNRYGSSTIAIFHGLKSNQRLITIDTEHDQRFVPNKIFKDPRVTFIFGDCNDLNSYLESRIPIPVDIDILFTDTLHFYEQVSAEFEVYEPLLSNEALIIIDDINLNDKRKFFDEIKHKKYDLTDICHIQGFGAIHYVRPLPERKKTKEERIKTALLRSATIWKQRYNKLTNSPRKMSNRISEIRTEQMRASIKKILGENLTNWINKIRRKI